MTYRLWYWPEIQGRGEFVRLALEAGGIEYRDCARDQGVEALLDQLEKAGPRGPLAPPFLELPDRMIAQTPAILQYLGERHHIAPSAIEDRLWLHQLQLTIADAVTEAHNVHHPVEMGDYYEGQKPEAARAAKQFRGDRMPKYLDHFERALEGSEGEWLAGHGWSYADCSLFHLIEGLRHMFPKRMKTLEKDRPNLVRLSNQVADIAGVAAYLNSDRRLGFGRQGIFRDYPELDGE